MYGSNYINGASPGRSGSPNQMGNNNNLGGNNGSGGNGGVNGGSGPRYSLMTSKLHQHAHYGQQQSQMQQQPQHVRVSPVSDSLYPNFLVSFLETFEAIPAAARARCHQRSTEI